MKTAIIKLFGYVGKDVQQKLNLGSDFMGFDLLDIIAQVNAAGQVDRYVFVVDSPGGFVSIGKDTHGYITSLKGEKFTLAYNECSSIATMALLSVPLENRYAIAGAKIMIHNPWTIVEGDANELISVGNQIMEEQQALLEFYSEATGITEEGLQPLMNVQSYLDTNQATTLNFISKVLSIEQAVAMFGGDVTTPLAAQTKPLNCKVLALYNQKTKTMKTAQKNNKSVLDAVSALASAMGYKGNLKSLFKAAGASPAPITLQTDDGKTIVVQKDANDPTPDVPQVGDVITLDGKPAPSATLTTADGTTIETDADSKISAISDDDDSNTEMESRAKAAEKKAAELETELATLKTEHKETKDLLVAVQADIKTLTDVMAATKSKGKPTAEEARLAAERKKAGEKTEEGAEDKEALKTGMAAIREEARKNLNEKRKAAAMGAKV